MPLLEQVLETFPDKVRVVFKNYPLVQSHKFAGKAALTAQAAHLQGKFWVVHDEFFKIHDQLNDEKIQEIVRAFYYGWYGELVSALPPIKDGRISAPAGPGLGLKPNADRFKAKDARRRISK